MAELTHCAMATKVAVTAKEPKAAPLTTAAVPVSVAAPAVRVPPPISITRATPRLAPLDMPNIEGPASGLRNAVCNISPQAASDAPESRAVMVWGSLDSSTMKRCTSVAPWPPMRIRSTSVGGMWAAPVPRQSRESAVMAKVRNKYGCRRSISV